jgi:type VI secretion system protein ImpI/type VI secretion system protein
MTLTLTVLRCPDRVAPETRRLDGGEFILGRGPGADWVLTDPGERPQLSRKHCSIVFAGGAWTVTDTSTNGTMLNGGAVPQGGPSRALRDGDRIGLGPYEIEVGLNEAAQPSPAGRGVAHDPFAGSAFPAAGPGGFSSPFGTGGGFGGGPEAGNPFGSPHAPLGEHDGLGPPSVRLPDDFAHELFAPPPPPAAQADHSPAQGDVIVPPVIRPVLPAGWDDEPGNSVAAPPPPAPAPPAPPPSAPVAPPETPFGADLPPLPAEPMPPPQSPPPPSPPRAAAPEAAAGQDGLLAAFMHGAGMADARPADPAKALHDAGAAFRAFVRGLREVLVARAEIKSAFRIDQTMVRSRRNNPLKFAAGDDDALAALLGTGRRTDMSAAEAVDGALADIRRHELATMAAMQEAMRELLDRLDPAKFRAAAQGGLLPAQRTARAFEAYEAEFGKLRETLGEKLDDAFGRAFAVAYERVVADLQSKDQAL